MNTSPLSQQETMVSVGGNKYKSFSPTSLTVVSATAGRLCKVIVTVVNGANAINLFDNATAASGTIVGVVPASATAGTVIDLQIPVINGITAAATASAGTIVVTFE